MATSLNGTLLSSPKNASTVHRPTMTNSATRTISAEVSTKGNATATQTLASGNSALLLVQRPGVSSIASDSVSTLSSPTSRLSTTSTGSTSTSITSTGRSNSEEGHSSTPSSSRLTGRHSSSSPSKTESHSGATTLSTSTRSSVASVSAQPQQLLPHLDPRHKHQAAKITKILGSSLGGAVAAGLSGRLLSFLEDLGGRYKDAEPEINKLRWALKSAGIPTNDGQWVPGIEPRPNTPAEPDPRGPASSPNVSPAPPSNGPPPSAPQTDAPPADPPNGPPVSLADAPVVPPAAASGEEEEEYWAQDLYTATPPQTPPVQPVQPASGSGEGSKPHPSEDDTSSLDSDPYSLADAPGAQPNTEPTSEDPYLMPGALQDPNDPWINPDYSPPSPPTPGSGEGWERYQQQAWEDAWAAVADLEERIAEAAWLEPDLLSPRSVQAKTDIAH